MKKTLKSLLFLFIFCLPLSVLASNDIIMNLNKSGGLPEYTVGEKVELKFSYINSAPEMRKLKLVCGLSALNKEFPPMPSMNEVELLPSEKSKEYTCEMSISEVTPADTYKAYVEIYDDKDNVISQNEMMFLVTGTKKTITATLQTCENETCENTNSVFINGSTVYLKLNGDINEKTIETYLVDSSTEKKDLLTNNLVNYDKEKSEMIMKIENLKPGSYSVITDISGDGYEAASITTEFAVIEQAAIVNNVSVCNLDNQCKDGETIQNCPLDCKISTNKILSPENSGEKKSDNKIKLYVFILIIIILFVIAGFVFRKVFIKNKNID